MSGPAADAIEVSSLDYSRRYQSISSGDMRARQIWGQAGLQDIEASPLDPNAEEAFQRIRPQIVTIIQPTPRPYDPAHLRGPRKSPIATVDGVRLCETDRPVEDGVDAVFIRCSSKPFAAELEKKIHETGVLETVQTKFELCLHYGPPMWDWSPQASSQIAGTSGSFSNGDTEANIPSTTSLYRRGSGGHNSSSWHFLWAWLLVPYGWLLHFRWSFEDDGRVH